MDDNLNPVQFTVDLGWEHNVEHDIAVARKTRRENAGGLEAGKKMPGVGSPDPAYYHQPSSKIRQMALPGMEMSVQDHLDALSKRTGKEARLQTSSGEHELSLKEPNARPWEYSYLSWNSNRLEAPERGSLSATKPDGEIQMVQSSKRGEAAAMFGTAEALAHEHGYTFPKHSEERMPEGVQWSQAMMKRRGEKVW